MSHWDSRKHVVEVASNYIKSIQVGLRKYAKGSSSEKDYLEEKIKGLDKIIDDILEDRVRGEK